MTRVGDQERERAARQLRGHYLRGRLTEDELDDRLSIALAARSHGDVRRAFDELPPAWRDGVEELRAALAETRVAARRFGVLLAASALWCVVSLAIVVGLGLAALVGDVTDQAIAAALLIWLLVTYTVVRAVRRSFRRK
jgi:uncharacterized protein DUF1707